MKPKTETTKGNPPTYSNYIVTDAGLFLCVETETMNDMFPVDGVREFYGQLIFFGAERVQ